jgi:hypothetical protein
VQEVDAVPNLRPLGIGEILDRAVNLAVQKFVPLLIIYIAYGIPFALVGYAFTARYAGLLQTFSAPRANPAVFPTIPPEFILFAFVLVVVFLVTLPLPTAALLESTSAFYFERTTSFGQAYRVAFERYGQMLLLTLLYIVVGLGLYIAVGIVLVLLGLGIALIAAASKIVAIVLGILLGIAGISAAIVLLVIVSLMLQVGYFTCVIERASCVPAFRLAIKRTFSGIGVKRTLLVGLVYFAISIGIGIVSIAGQLLITGLLQATTAGTIVSLVYSGILRVLAAVFVTVFLTIFYFDLRVREEGLDLELAAARAGAGTAPIT